MAKKVYLKPSKILDRLRDNFNGEWEIGSWNNGSWRIVRGNVVICGSGDSAKVVELDALVAKIELGHLIDLKIMNDLDIRAVFDNDLYVDFIASIKSDPEDDTFHIFCPDNKWVGFYPGLGWTLEESNVGDLRTDETEI